MTAAAAAAHRGLAAALESREKNVMGAGAGAVKHCVHAREEGIGCLPEAMSEKRRLVQEKAEEFLEDSEGLGVLGTLFSCA